MAEQKKYAEFNFDNKNWQRILKKIEKKWADVKNRGAISGIIAAVVFREIQDHFAKKEGPKGPWDEWSKAYRKHLEKTGRSGRNILQTGSPPRLRQAIMPTNSPKDMPFRKMLDGVLFYNNATTKSGFPYAAHHDEGRSSWKGNPRSFMWISNKGVNEVADQIGKWLLEDID